MSGDLDRARAVVARLRKEPCHSEEVFAAFEELDRLAPDVVREALEPWVGPAPDVDRLDDALRRAHGLPPRPLRLRIAAVVKDADVLDLGPIAEEQLRRAGKSWDGLDLEPEERLDGEIEGSFAGTLEHRVLSDVATEAPLFDVLLFAEDAGIVFRAGSIEPIGAVAYGRVEMADRHARAAIQSVLDANANASPSPSPTRAPPPTELKASAKKATAKKATAKKATAKNATAKKATAKKATAKKATAKKATAKKATARKATAKK